MGVSVVLRNIRNITHITRTKGRKMQKSTRISFERLFEGDSGDCYVDMRTDGAVAFTIVTDTGEHVGYTFTDAEWEALTRDLNTLRYLARKEAAALVNAQSTTQKLDEVVLDVAQPPEPEWLDELPSSHDTAVADGI